LVELMRSAVENLKRADGERARDGMAVTDDLS
jgi:hypothetical protein